MKPFACLLFILTVLSGCASDVARDNYGRPRMERLSPDVSISAAGQPLGIADIVALEKNGSTPQDIVWRLRAGGQRISMDAGQQTALREKGASTTLLQALREAEAQAKEADRLTAEADRLAEQRTRVEYVRALPYYRYYDPYPYWGYPTAYIGYGSGYRHSGWAGGMSWGW